MRIWYQSYVDYENGALYWDMLRAHLAQIVDPGTEIEVHGITPHDSHTPTPLWNSAVRAR
jgi:allantoin racemase